MNRPLARSCWLGVCLGAMSFISAAGAAVNDLPSLIVGGLQGIANKKTPIGVTDGNPFAAPEYFAADAFDRFALTPAVLTQTRNMAADVRSTFSDINLHRASSSAIELSPGFATRLSDNVGLSLSLPMQFRSVGDADVYIGGIVLGVPISVVAAKEGGLSWDVTPWFNTGVAGSTDLAQGGYMYGGGVTSRVGLVYGNFTFAYGLQLGWEGAFPIGYGSEFNYEQTVSQPILKNGLKAEWTWGSFVPFASITYTNLLEGGYVDNYWTPTAGCQWNINDHCHLSAALVGNYANGFSSTGGNLSFGVEF